MAQLNITFPYIKVLVKLIGVTFGIQILLACSNNQSPTISKIASFEEAMKSKRDVWGEAAMAEPNGASYEFFENLLPPPRYVNAAFHYYPIVLCGPYSKVKARLISNGGGINLPGGTRSWRDVGTPVKFRVGPDEFLFGSMPDRLSEPVLVDGWLPIPQICYSHRTPIQSEGNVPLNQVKQDSQTEVYRVEAFAATDQDLAEKGVIFVRFDLSQGNDGYIAVEVEAGPGLNYHDGNLIASDGKVVAIFDRKWQFDGRLMKARLQPGTPATLAIPTIPLDKTIPLDLNQTTYSSQRDVCINTWKTLVDKGMQINTPEPRVNNAYKNSLCQTFQLINGNEMRYSSGNQYDKMYEAEGSDAALALLVCGYASDMRSLMEPLFKFSRKGLELHNAGFKIIDLCRYYWQTGDKSVIEEMRPLWEKEIRMLDGGRTGAGGLYPEEQYCGDIHTFVQSLNVNANAWRAFRDLGAILTNAGIKNEGEYYTNTAVQYRKIVLDAIHKAVSRETIPPFVPIALSGGEPVHDPIIHSRIGSYWNIIIGYTINSGIFPPGSEEENWIPQYQEQHGGLCMGMLRSGGGAFNFWTGENRVNPLYGTRYSLNSLRRDNPERTLVSFYGMLAQGVTRNTFVGGEGSSLKPVDERGRDFYCPPNSAASAHVLSMLRYMLVQDLDLNDDGIPETLRLGFATPRRWLEDGKTIDVRNAPTAFGLTSFSIKSNLKAGEVIVNFTPPSRTPQKTFIRVRVPDKWQVKSAFVGTQILKVDEGGTIDVSSLTGPAIIHFKVKEI